MLVNRIKWPLLAVCAIAGLSACGTYYRVTDPASGREYYTSDVDRDDTTVTFEDARTGRDVTLQSSEVSKISKDDYRAATGR
ncbi:MAG TPA: hypothetical protein VFU53_06745 [Burkholderiales bacterium]|nr:hypothetical protein [Burkholderiales bacterium]